MTKLVFIKLCPQCGKMALRAKLCRACSKAEEDYRKNYRQRLLKRLIKAVG